MSRRARSSPLVALVLVLAFAFAGCIGDDGAPAAADDGVTVDAAPPDDGATDPHAHHMMSDGGMTIAETSWHGIVPTTMAALDTMPIVSEFTVPTNLSGLELRLERSHTGPELDTPIARVFAGDQMVAEKAWPGSGPSPTGGSGTLTMVIDAPSSGAWHIGYHIDTVDRQNEHRVDVVALGLM